MDGKICARPHRHNQRKWTPKLEAHLGAHPMNDLEFTLDHYHVTTNCVVHKLMEVYSAVDIKTGNESFINYNLLRVANLYKYKVSYYFITLLLIISNQYIFIPWLLRTELKCSIVKPFTASILFRSFAPKTIYFEY